MYDILILGAGPAGISAALYAASRGKKVLILEKSQVGGLIGNVSTVTHYTALLPGETGASFAARMQEQALRAGVHIAFETVTEVSLEGEIKTLHTNKGVYQAPRVILAGGGTPRKLGIPGEQELAGRGIGLNAARDGARYTGKNIYVVGGADGAVKEALYLASFARRLTLIHFEEQLGCIAEFRQKAAATPNITLRLGTRLGGRVRPRLCGTAGTGARAGRFYRDTGGPGLRRVCVCGHCPQHRPVPHPGSAGRVHSHRRKHADLGAGRLRGGRHPLQAGAAGGHRRGGRRHCGHSRLRVIGSFQSGRVLL